MATIMASRSRRGSLLRPIPLLATAVLLAVGTFLAGPRVATSPPGASASPPQPQTVALPGAGGGALPLTQVDAAIPLKQIDAAIATWTANLRRDPADFIAATHLAELYLARGRLTGLATDHARALDAVDRALTTEPDLLPAQLLRTQVLLAGHDFVGAEAAAATILQVHPDLPQALAALGDAHLDRGRYDAAERAYARLASAVDAPAVTARQARLAAVTGSLPVARQLAARALRAAVADPAVSLADRAWYHVLDGTLAFQAGNLADAEAAYRSALELHPGSPAAAAGLGRALAARGHLNAAIDAYEQAVATVPQPETLAALGDLLALTGRSAEAETRYEQVRAYLTIEDAAGTRLIGRALVRFLANHGERTGVAVQMARAELSDRSDVYGWDALAWALLADGQVAAADEAMAAARAHGTQDALLDYHAGAIAAAAGRTDEAIGLLRAALERNPAFDPLQADRARALLAELEADR